MSKCGIEKPMDTNAGELGTLIPLFCKITHHNLVNKANLVHSFS